MIRWRGNRGGREVVGLGIEAGNVERLMNGEPILVKGETVGIPFDIFIHYGATSDALVSDLEEAGIRLPKAQPIEGG